MFFCSYSVTTRKGTSKKGEREPQMLCDKPFLNWNRSILFLPRFTHWSILVVWQTNTRKHANADYRVQRNIIRNLHHLPARSEINPFSNENFNETCTVVKLVQWSNFVEFLIRCISCFMWLDVFYHNCVLKGSFTYIFKPKIPV